jgi:hypothetical protein
MKVPNVITPEQQERICSCIRSGSYPHAAALAAGVPRRVFTRWMRKRGEKYARFRRAIREAEGLARVSAETRTHNKNPLAWLKYGPGKETEETPGWSNAPRGGRRGEKQTASVLAQRQTRELLAVLLRVLEAYPEARAAVAEALDGQGVTTGGDSVEKE